MGKRQRRRRRKEPSGEEVISGFIVAAIALLYVSGVSLGTVVWYFLMGLAMLLIVWFAIWFIQGMIKSIEPVDLKTGQSKLKSKKSIQQDTRIADSLSTENNPTATEWTEELIAQLEWRVFEKLCIRLWQEKGYSVKETGAGADGGVDFYLYANVTEQKIGAVQCKSWSKRQIDVKVVRELQGVVAAEQLQLGLLMYSGKLSRTAQEFVTNPAVSIRVQGNNNILNEIQKLEADKQTQLLIELFTEDYQVPSCPNCDMKMVERTAKKNWEYLLGLREFP